MLSLWLGLREGETRPLFYMSWQKPICLATWVQFDNNFLGSVSPALFGGWLVFRPSFITPLYRPLGGAKHYLDYTDSQNDSQGISKPETSPGMSLNNASYFEGEKLHTNYYLFCLIIVSIHLTHRLTSHYVS